jgi:transaldolase
MDIERLRIDEAKFEEMHKEDRMASDKLSEGIKGFSDSLVKLEDFLAKRLCDMGAGHKEELAVR